MAKTRARQVLNLQPSVVYDDTLSMAGAESALNMEEDLNFLRTQAKIISGETDWFAALSGGSLKQLSEKAFTFSIQNTTDITVTAAQNWMELTGAAKPSDVIAFGAGALGALTAQLAGAIGSHSLTALAGNANIVEVRDAATNNEIFDGTEKIFGLLQVGNLATDGNAFGDTGNDQGQISFVTINPSTEALQAASVASIAGKTIEYAYRKRSDFFNLPEGAFDNSVQFVENISTATIDLQQAYDNDAAGDVLLSAAKNFTVNMNANADIEFKDGATSYMLFDQSLGVIRVNRPIEMLNGEEVRWYDVGSSNFIGFSAPALTANVSFVWPAADATVADQALVSDSAGNLSFKTVIPVSKKAYTVLSADVAKNTDLALSVFTDNPDSMVFPATAAEFLNNFEVYVNGDLLLGGANAAANHDYYYQSTTALRFEEDLDGTSGNPDIVQIIQRKVG